MTNFLKVIGLAFAFTLLVCACAGVDETLSSTSSPPPDDIEQSELFELVYEWNGRHTFFIYRYIPDDTLFIARASQGGMVQMFNGYNNTYPAHYTENLEPYLNP